MFVFAYGSLIWRPGFDHLGARPALLRGWHRRFCIWSRHYRGSPDAPGLVLGLDRGGSCHGVVFEVAPAQATAVLEYLDARENLAGEIVYRRRLVRVTPLGGAPVEAVTYVADRTHAAYARPCLETVVATIAAGQGQAGSNREYLLNTLALLREWGMRDRGLEMLASRMSTLSSPCDLAGSALDQGGLAHS